MGGDSQPVRPREDQQLGAVQPRLSAHGRRRGRRLLHSDPDEGPRGARRCAGGASSPPVLGAAAPTNPGLGVGGCAVLGHVAPPSVSHAPQLGRNRSSMRFVGALLCANGGLLRCRSYLLCLARRGGGGGGRGGYAPPAVLRQRRRLFAQAPRACGFGIARRGSPDASGRYTAHEQALPAPALAAGCAFRLDERHGPAPAGDAPDVGRQGKRVSPRRVCSRRASSRDAFSHGIGGGG
mmetsp:Transcript_78585/g.157166  ORF Transcript_78585/g.157166 Transcript_78585/m.157166 type:complete len:237 (-) Transcript_78585:1243-1953(-)